MVAYIILGIVQGLTEFLPVSSSGHLVIVQQLLGIDAPGVSLEIVLHAGTLLAVCLFFAPDILRFLRDKKLAGQVLAATAFTAAIGLAGKDLFESLFNSPVVVSAALGVTGVMLVLTRFFGRGSRARTTLADALWMGFAQGIAVTPGISRSGSTLAALMFRQVEKETAFRFSFIASIPAVAGVALLKCKDINEGLQAQPTHLIAGFICSFLIGLAALWLLRRMVARSRLHWFGYYCILVSVSGMIFLR